MGFLRFPTLHLDVFCDQVNVSYTQRESFSRLHNSVKDDQSHIR